MKKIMQTALVSAFLASGLVLLPGGVSLASEGGALKHVDWSFDGPFGAFDRAQLKRGFQVYKEVCAACHSVKFVSYRNLGEAGGPEFTEAEVKTIAAASTVTDGPNGDGEMFERPAESKDRIVKPFPNDNAARAANNGAMPPDLSLMTKARKDGSNYVYSVLTGYADAPEGVVMADGMNFNHYFPGQQIAMPAPLSDDQVTYEDGTPATLDQMSKDVTAFLTWTAEPKLEERHKLGFKVMIFLTIFAGLLFAVYKRVWEDQH
ncbi:MAG: cytochrome c1 [Alphaproteobacteria bacterium]